LAYDYGTPRLLSDYKYDVNDNGAPGATDTAVPDVDFDQACSTKDGDWNCQQRWTTTRGMIAFHNYVAGTAVTSWQDDAANNIAFSRGGKGFVALNNSAEDKDVEYATDMPDGEYCDVYGTQDCSKTVTVSGGKVKMTIPAMQAVAIYGGATKATHPAADAATDPSTPDVVVPDTTLKPDDTTLTVYYKAAEGQEKAYIHYGVGDDWTAVPGVEMTKDAQGYFTATLDTKGKAIEMVFNDGNNNWDNPNGGGNYTPALGITHVGVANHEMTVGNPESIGAQTRLLVHYKAAESDPGRGVYFWGTDKSGNDLAGAHHAFTGTDCYGKVGEYVIDGSFDELGMIVTTDGWDKFGGDRIVKVAKDGTAEVWIDGTGDADSTLDTAPADYACKAASVELTVHYQRLDGMYFQPGATYINDQGKEEPVKVPQWDIWTWNANSDGFAGKFTSHDDWGEVARLSFSNYAYQSDNGISDFGMLRRFGVDEWAKKDGGDGDIKMTASALVFDAASNTAKGEVWLVQDDATVYTARPALGARIVSAEISGNAEVSAKLSRNADEASVKDAVKLTDADGNTVEVKDVKVEGTMVTVTVAQDLDLTAKYVIEIGDFGSADVVAGSVVRTDAFDQAYAYDGDDLGATWADGGSTFKVWAPTAKDVKLVTYQDNSEKSAEAGAVDMQRGDKGVWSVTAKVDDGTAYAYRVSFADGTVNTTADPYAKAAVVNGRRSVVLSGQRTTVAGSTRMEPFTSPADAIIAETHIRDFTKSETSGVSEANRGKYLGMVETGTVNSSGTSTGVDYLKDLGITHLQIQPMFDYVSVDETKPLDDSNYNWGYDPLNYNVPEGSYASDATDPATRIVEAKEMVDGLHDNGIRVIMDVVYNHVADAATNPFGQTVPGYYFRYQNGSLVNNSGCGNDTASERAMMRKYIVDSVTYWAKEYHMDGFRFDLMGLHDLETMKQVRAALDEIDPSIIVVGEGWDMNSTMDKSLMSIQPNGYELDNGTSTVSFFNDSIRDGLKGSVFSDTGQGFVNGAAGLEERIANNMLGCQNQMDATLEDGSLNPATCNNGNNVFHYANAAQSVNYVEIHDNLTLNDKLEKSLFVDGEGNPLPDADTMGEQERKEKIAEAAKLADASIFLANGIAEFQIGQEFLRTKGGDGNSYNVGDGVNMIDWNRLDDAVYADSAAYVKQLIALRKSVSAFRMADYGAINATAKVIKAADGVVAYRIGDTKGTYVVVLNANADDVDLEGIDPQGYEVLLGADAADAADAPVEAVAFRSDDIPVEDAVAAADTTDTAAQGLEVPAVGAKMTVAEGDAVKVPARSALVLATEALPQAVDPGANGADGAAAAAAAADRISGIASTGSSIAVLVLVALALAVAASALLMRRERRS
ncbi:type I pullulanase, partial [Bifidobacterium cuniculi]